MEGRPIKTFHMKDLNIKVEEKTVFNFYIHTHSYFEMTLYNPFDGEILLNEERIIPDTITAILIAPSDYHKTSVRSDECSGYIKLSFPREMFGETELPETSIVLNKIPPDDFFVSLYKEITNNNDNEQYKKVLVSALVCIMRQKGRKIATTEQSGLGIRAIRIINEKFGELLTLAEVADRLNVTPQYLSKMFKTDMGITFSQYMKHIRLRCAEKMLKETSESITNICMMCGYGNLSHFIRVFNKVYGVTPAVYRRNNRV